MLEIVQFKHENTMDNKLLLIKSATLLFRESQLPIKTDSSADLVRTVIKAVNLNDISSVLSTDRDMIIGMKDLILEMCSNDINHEYSRNDLMQRFKIILGNNEKLYEAVEQGIMEELTESQIKRNITNIRKSINNHFKEQNIEAILTKASNMFRFQRNNISNVNEFVASIIDQLEPLQVSQSGADPAVVGDVDIGNEESVSAVFNQVKNKTGGGAILKTGFTALNKMLQGGFRRGEMVVIGALQHKYKTGFTLSLFQQIAVLNKPTPKDPSKKPLLLRISFEDDITNNLQFLYQSLKFDETRMDVSIDGISVDEMSKYVQSKMQVNGYHIKLLRVDPTQWTYKSICNTIIDLEAQGYEIELLMLDYLALVPTTGCRSDGPMGTPVRDLFRRIRNFCGPKDIAVITPHQLSTEAKQLTRMGIPEASFVKEINEKGYYAETKQLDQEVDLELYIHIAKYNKESYLTVQRGKHRIPTILPEEDKYFMLKFPRGMPIPSDRDGEDQSYKKYPQPTNSGDKQFTF